MEKTFRALVCQMYGNYSKTKSEIMKHYQKDPNIFFILNRRSWDFKPLLEKEKPTLIDISSDKPKALITNVASQPLQFFLQPLDLQAGLHVFIRVGKHDNFKS